jgi:hypothetical protein
MRKSQAYITIASTSWYNLGILNKGVSKNFPVKLLGIRFTDAISFYKPGLQERYRDIPLQHPVR